MATALIPTAPATRLAPRNPDSRSARLVIRALVVIGIIPVALGVAHLATVIAGVDVSAKALYFLSMPVPIALHVIGAAAYVIAAPFQFSASLRRRAPQVHRTAGRLLVVAGLAVAVSALWMTLTLPHQPGGGDLLYGARLLFGTAMIASIGLGFGAIRCHDVPAHRRWMTRAYAIGLGAATQIPVLLVAELIAGPPDEMQRAVLMTAAWLVNLAIAEMNLRRR